jgi:primosomal protein N' (replication factor Y)
MPAASSRSIEAMPDTPDPPQRDRGQGQLFGDAAPTPATTPPIDEASAAAARSSRRASRRPAARPEHAAGRRFTRFVSVAVATDTGLLSYGVPAALEDAVVVGRRVTVPVRGRLEVGIVWGDADPVALGLDPARIRPVGAALDAAPIWPEALCRALDAAARYYHTRLGMMVRTALPGTLRRTGEADDRAPVREVWRAELIEGVDWPIGLRRPERRVLERLLARGAIDVSDLRREVDPETGRVKVVSVPQTLLESLAERGLIRLWQERRLRDRFAAGRDEVRDRAPGLMPAQAAALERLRAPLDAARYEGFLLRGVTGSGKTEVYLGLIEAALAAGRGALVLVPEIALTPQLVDRFRARFGPQVEALHSGMAEGDRHDALERIRRGESRVAVGPRSALFAPMFDLGVIVLDECHDSSFKQQSGVRYHARDLALLLAREHGCVALLGSATPSCEEWALANAGRLTLVELPERVGARELPEAWLIDLREAERLPDPDEPERKSMLSRPLIDAIAETVRLGQQAIVLHNRRGFATSMVCRGCGAAFECPRCAVTLVKHQRQRRLRCHICDYAAPLEQPCTHCHATSRVEIGAGTERLEHTLGLALPGVRLARFDRDTAQGDRLLDMLDRFRNRELDVLVGTQMLAKGHDFPAVTLVGVVLAESGLQIPDFRAKERTFQLLTQVAGRAGRGDLPGRVLVQTWMPEHPAILAALAQDHDAFLAHELPARAAAGYPPYGFLALLETRHKELDRAEQAMRELVQALRERGADVRGPVPAGVARVREVWRVHALLADQDRRRLHAFLSWIDQQRASALPPGVSLFVDVDPADFS